MGTITCPRCTATTEADSIDEGKDRLDHALGLSIGKPCAGTATLIFTGKAKPNPKETSKTVGNTKPQSIKKD